MLLWGRHSWVLVMGSVRIVSYKCQAAARKNTTYSILLTFSFACVLGLHGTRTRRPKWGWHGNSSRIDYVAISDFDLSTLRDHLPVLIQINASNVFRCQPINEARWDCEERWDWNKLCMPRLYEQDIQIIFNTTQSWFRSWGWQTDAKGCICWRY